MPTSAKWQWSPPINNDLTARSRSRSLLYPLELSLRLCGGGAGLIPVNRIAPPGFRPIRAAGMCAANAPVFQENAKPYA